MPTNGDIGRGEWLRFLESERAGARSTLSSWIGLFAITLAALVAAFLNPTTLASSEIRRFVGAFSVWALSLICTATYGWFQYLGSVRGISHRYYVPDSGDLPVKGLPVSEYPRILLQRRVMVTDYWELRARDVGTILWIMFRKYSYFPAKTKALVWPIRIVFWITLLLSIGGVTLFLSFGLGLTPLECSFWAFVAATVSMVASFTVLLAFAQMTGRAYHELRGEEIRQLLEAATRARPAPPQA